MTDAGFRRFVSSRVTLNTVQHLQFISLAGEEIHYLERPELTVQPKAVQGLRGRKGQGRTRSSSPAPSRSDAAGKLHEEATGSRSRSSEAAVTSKKPKSRSPSPAPKEKSTGKNVALFVLRFAAGFFNT